MHQSLLRILIVIIGLALLIVSPSCRRQTSAKKQACFNGRLIGASLFVGKLQVFDSRSGTVQVSDIDLACQLRPRTVARCSNTLFFYGEAESVPDAKHESGVYSADLVTGQCKIVLATKAMGYHSSALTAVGDHLYAIGKECLWEVNSADGHATQLFAGNVDSSASLASDGSWIYFVNRNGSLTAFSPSENRTEACPTATPNASIMCAHSGTVIMLGRDGLKSLRFPWANTNDAKQIWQVIGENSGWIYGFAKDESGTWAIQAPEVPEMTVFNRLSDLAVHETRDIRICSCVDADGVPMNYANP